MNSNELRSSVMKKLECETLSLRDAEPLCGVSFATLSRFIRGGIISSKTSDKLEYWLLNQKAPMRRELQTKQFNLGGKKFTITIEVGK